MNKFQAAASLFALALTVCASEAAAGSHSISLSMATLPSEYEADVEQADGGSTNFSGKDDAGNSLTIMYQYRANTDKPASFIIGAGLDFTNFDYGSGEERQVGVRAEPGVAFNLTPEFRLEAVGLIALGSSTYDGLQGEGAWASAGILLRPVYTMRNGLSLSGQLGIVSHVTAYDMDDGSSITYERGGVSAGLSIGYQFR